MSRIGWIIGVLLLVLIGVAVWVVQDERLSIETRPPDNFAQMSRAEQAEWLVRQILARASRQDWWVQIQHRLFGQPSTDGSPLVSEIELIGTASVQYERPQWIRHARQRVPEEWQSTLHAYLVELHAEQGKPHAMWREVKRILEPERQAFALARAGEHLLQHGDYAEAQRCFATAIALLKQSQHLPGGDAYKRAIELTARHTPGCEDAFILSGLLFHTDSLRMVAEFWFARGRFEPVRMLTQLAQREPPDRKLVAQTVQANALIQMGNLREGFRALPSRISAVDAVCLARALHRRKQTAYARGLLGAAYRVFAQAVRTAAVQELGKVRDSLKMSAEMQRKIRLLGINDSAPATKRDLKNPSRAVVPEPEYSGMVHDFHKPLTIADSYLIEWDEVQYVSTQATLDWRRNQFYLACCEQRACNMLEGLAEQAFGAACVQLHLEAAACYYQAGQTAKAQEQVIKALHMMSALDRPTIQARSIRILHQAGARALATRVLREATRWIEQAPPHNRVDAIKELAAAHAANEDYVQAIRAAMALPSHQLQREALAAILKEMLRHEQAR